MMMMMMMMMMIRGKEERGKGVKGNWCLVLRFSTDLRSSSRKCRRRRSSHRLGCRAHRIRPLAFSSCSPPSLVYTRIFL